MRKAALAGKAAGKTWIVDSFTRALLDRAGHVSRSEWNARKQGRAWLFPKSDGDGLLNEGERRSLPGIEGEGSGAEEAVG